jgi:hypothetical protein
MRADGLKRWCRCIAAILLLSGCLRLHAADITLAWNPNPEPNISGYTVYCGTSSRNYSSSVDAGTSTVFTVAGLVPGTYYFAVTAYASNEYESAFSDEVSITLTGTDGQPPGVSHVEVTDVSTSGATVRWSTVRPATSQLEYGRTTRYGNSTLLDSALSLSHSQEIDHLLPGSLYHVRAISLTDSGRAEASADFSFWTAQPALTLTDVKVARVNLSQAIITWATNLPADSQVEYRLSGRSLNVTPSNPALVTIHSQLLAGLGPGVYEFHAQSVSSDGTLATSDPLSFTIPEAGAFSPNTTLLFPVLDGRPSDGVFTGIAVTNLDRVSAQIQLTAFDSSGAPLMGPGILNPVPLLLDAGEHFALMPDQLWGPGFTHKPDDTWFSLDSSTSHVVGLSLNFNPQLTLFDGVNASVTPVTISLIGDMSGGARTSIRLINPNAYAAAAVLELYDSIGTLRARGVRIELPPSGPVDQKLADIFPGTTPEPGDYVVARCSQKILVYERIPSSATDAVTLAGQDFSAGASLLYCPYYAIDDAWQSAVSIINLDPISGAVAIRLIGDNGDQIGPTRWLDLSANGKIYLRDTSLFGPTAGHPSDGYLEISAERGIHIAGTVFLTNSNSGFAAGLPLISVLQRSMVFGHVVSMDPFFTGITLLNPWETVLNATIRIFDGSGKLMGSVDQQLLPQQRTYRLLTDYMPQLFWGELAGGFAVITADSVFIGFALYGAGPAVVTIAGQPSP